MDGTNGSWKHQLARARVAPSPVESYRLHGVQVEPVDHHQVPRSPRPTARAGARKKKHRGRGAGDTTWCPRCDEEDQYVETECLRKYVPKKILSFP